MTRDPFTIVIEGSEEHRLCLADPRRYGLPIVVAADPPREPRAPTDLMDTINRAAATQLPP